ncbi:CRISPR-associated endonuclease Cas1 [Candidatus Bathyarchaeota archaeon]|nr:CRISPR-associated endonuclease Cas1 [Candidatus Bathyarchaeota archaeon]
MPFRNAKTLKVELSDYGSYLGRAEGCFEVRKKSGKTERYPHFENEIGEAVLKSGSYVSVDALIDLALWNIDTYIMTRKNRVVAVLKNLEDDSHVKTRLCQYEALSNGKGIAIAKQFLVSKIEGQNAVLKKYGLKPLDIDARHQIGNIQFESLESARKKLVLTESHNAKFYFNQIFKLFPEKIRPEKRTGFKAYDGLNNVFNFAYYVLKCRVHKALLKAKLEPYLGFLHSVQVGKPSLVCDFQELYRYLIDDFLIERCRKLRKKDFVFVTDFMMHLKMGKRIHLCEFETNDLAEGLNLFCERKVQVPRIRYGSEQTIDTLINEEAYLFAKFLRHERETWVPRIASLA